MAENKMKEITFAQAINEAISEEMRRDETVFMLGEDIGVYCGAFGMSKGMIAELAPSASWILPFPNPPLLALPLALP